MAKRGRRKRAAGSKNGATGASEARVNKSEMIRTIAKDEGLSSPTQIRNLLAERGVEVSVAFVSTILSKARSQNGKVRRRRRRTVPAVHKANGRARSSATASGSGSLELIQAAANLCKLAGSAQGARAAIDVVEEIAQSIR